MIAKSKDSRPTWTDPDDAPEITDEWIESAELREGDKVIRRGRPPVDMPKKAVTIRYDAEVVETFKATGKGWQTRMNAALKDWLKDHSPSRI